MFSTLTIIFIELAREHPCKGFPKEEKGGDQVVLTVSLSLPLLWESLSLITTATLLLSLGSRESLFFSSH